MSAARPEKPRRDVLRSLFALAVPGRAVAGDDMKAKPDVDTASARFTDFTYAGSDTPAGTDAAPLPPGHFRNPVLPGFFPDPSICRVGNDFYLASSTFATFPGIALHHSRDLVDWRPVGHAVTRPGALRYAGLGVSRGLFAPDLSFHAGRWYLVCTMIGGGGNFVVTADRPEGPWSEPVWLAFEGIDPALFFDDDGSAWLLNNGAPQGAPRYAGHRAIWLQAFDTQRLQMSGPRRVLVDGGVDPGTHPVWIEGPHLLRHGGWYILSAAEGGTGLQHSQVVLRSRSITGPYEPWTGNPTLTQRDLDPRVPGAVTCTGHADFVQGPAGDWWAVFLGCRPLPEGHWLLGRETFLLPLQWTDDGWPRILPAGQRVPLTLPAPAGALPRSARHDTYRIDLRSAAPAPADGWITLRAPAVQAWRAGAAGLDLQARADALEGLGEPAVLLSRVQHLRFTVQCGVQLPQAAGVEAALVLFQSESQHDRCGVVMRNNGAVVLRLQRCDGGRVATLAEQELPVGTGALQMRVRADERTLHYDYAVDGGAWRTLLDGLGHRALSVQAAGDGNHFTGLLAGLHARHHASAAPAG